MHAWMSFGRVVGVAAILPRRRSERGLNPEHSGMPVIRPERLSECIGDLALVEIGRLVRISGLPIIPSAKSMSF
jgi:hypothetical protein